MNKLVIVLILRFSLAFCFHFEDNVNRFEVTHGCLQYNTNHGYDHLHPYYSTARFKNLQITPNNITIMRMGVLGRNDGHIRLSPVEYPYDNTEMNELVLSGWANTVTEIRRYTRTDHNNRVSNHIIKRVGSNGLLSEFIPMMFTMAIDQHGNVKLIKDGDVFPFAEFRDPKISFKYIGFCNWDVPVIYFFDCPFEVDRRDCTGMVFT